MIKFKPDKMPTWIDNSSICAFQRCEAKYAFGSLMHLTSPDPKPAMDYGTSAHCAIPLAQKSVKNFSIKDAKTAFIEKWREYGHADDPKRNPLNACKMIDHFASQSRPYDILDPPHVTVSTNGKYSDYEFAFCMSICDDDLAFPFAGRIDSVGRSKATGEIWPIEYKTTSELGSRFISCFDLNSQVIGYSIIVFLLFPSDKIGGTFVEALRVTSAAPECMCISVAIDEHVQDAFISLYKKVCRNIRECVEKGEWEQDFTACTTINQHGMPGYKCPFMSLCKVPDWRTMLASFIVEEWKPFAELESHDKDTK